MNASIQTISPRALHALQTANVATTLLDVRTPAEFASTHAAGARLFPLEQFYPDQIVSALGNEELGKKEPLYLICRSGARAQDAAEQLFSRGYHNVSVVEGGTEAWTKARLPTISKRQGRWLSLERQVQIAVGSLILLKVMFGFAIHPLFFMLVGALGAGLVFAGLTQNCAMARLLARMPWNNSTGQSVESSA